MSENKIQHGDSLSKLFKNYSHDMQYVDAFFKWEWPDGFTCPECPCKSYCSLKLRKLDLCNHCHLQMPVTANTIFENAKLTLTIWFLSVHLKTQYNAGISTLSLQGQVGFFL